MTQRDTELLLKLSPENEQLLRRAAALAGFESLCEFVQQAAVEKAMKIQEAAETITLDSESFDEFIADCESPGHPNNALEAAIQRRVTEKRRRLEHPEGGYNFDRNGSPKGKPASND